MNSTLLGAATARYATDPVALVVISLIPTNAIDLPPSHPPNPLSLQQLKPEYASAATQVKDVDASIVIGKVDATVETETAARFDIKGYPTLKWFIDGEPASDYGGGRTAADIVAWIKKRTGPPCTILDSAAAVEKAKEEGLGAFGYFAKYEGSDHEVFEALALKSDDVAFFKTDDKAIAASLGLPTDTPASFGIGRNYPDFGFEFVSSEGHDAFKGDGELHEKLNALLVAEKLPAFVEFSPQMSQRIFGSGIDHQIIIVAPPESFDKGSDLRTAIEGAAAKVKGKVIFVTGKVDNVNTDPIINFFSFDKGSTEPQIAGFIASAGKKFGFFEGETVSADSLEKLALGVLDGTAPRRTITEPVPEEPLEEGVTVVVGSTFESIVKDPTKDVLLEVYAPWCGHCKALAPIYVKLAKRFKNVDSVVIAKMDGTKNEVPDLDITGFPTLVFFPAQKDATAVAYDQSGRELKDLTKFIKKHAVVEYELPKKGESGKKEEEEGDKKHDEL